MAKPELGTKRVCPVTGRKFYDLNQNPVISPYTGEVVPIEAPTTRGRPDAAARAAAAAPEEVEPVAAPDAEFVSLEEADAEASGGKADLPDADEEEVEIEDAGDDTFLEEDEDADEDVSDIIGGEIEDEEET